MKKITLSLAAAILPAGFAAALVPQDVTISSDLTYTSDYVFRGIRFAEESFQPTFEATVGDFYAGIWANLPISNEDDRGSHELNYYGGFEFEIPGFEAATFDAGLTVYHLPRSNTNRNHEAFVGANFNLPQMPQVSAGVYYFYDFDSDIQTGEGSLGYSFPLEQTGLAASFDVTAFGGMVGGSTRDGEAYNYYGISGEVPFALTEFSAITVGVHYATAESHPLEDDKQRSKNVFWSVGYSSSF